MKTFFAFGALSAMASALSLSQTWGGDWADTDRINHYLANKEELDAETGSQNYLEHNLLVNTIEQVLPKTVGSDFYKKGGKETLEALFGIWKENSDVLSQASGEPQSMLDALDTYIDYTGMDDLSQKDKEFIVKRA